MRQYRRVIGVLLDHHEDVHFPLLVLDLSVLRDCPILLRFHCSASSFPTARTKSWFQRVRRPINEIEPDSRSDVPSTTIAYRRWSHSRFARHRALQRDVLVSRIRRGLLSIDRQPQRDDERRH